MRDPICITVDHRLEEHRRAERLYHADDPWWHPIRVGAGLVLLLSACDALLYGPRSGGVVAMAVGLLFVLDPYLWRDTCTWVRFRLGRRMREPVEVVFDGAGVTFRTEPFHARLKWSAYTGLLEDEALFLLPYGGHEYLVVPKRCFASEAQRVDFRRLVLRRLEWEALRTRPA